MPINQNSVKATVFKFLKTNGYKPTMLDSSGKEMAITDDADVFQFNFIKDGENYGTITIGIDGTGELTLYFGDDVAGSPAGSTDDGMLSFHELTARLRKLTFGKVSKFELSDIDNLKYDMAKRENTKKLDEGYYPMGKSGSYSDAVPTVKMVIKHTRKIEEGEQRYRNIAQIFIENSLGERVLAPTTKPGLARPFARHIAEGGLPNDERWNHIKEMCEDYTKMAGFVRATKNGQFNESTQQLVTEGTEHYLQLRESLRKMAGKRGYNEHFDNWSPTLIEDAAGADLSEMFMNATLDPRIESAMPILSKISRGRTSMNEVAEITELSEWADQLVSERLAPKSMPQLDDLAGMLSDEIVVGPNAMNAKAMLASVNLEDDELNGLLEELSEQDPDADAVETIINWMEQSDDHRMHSVIDKIERPTTPEVAESLRPGERHHYEDDPETGERVYKGIRGDQYQSPKKPHQFPDDSQARAQRQYDRQEPKEGVAEGYQLDELSKDTLKSYFPKRHAQAKAMAKTDYDKVKKIAQSDLPRALRKLKDPEYGQQGVAEGSLEIGSNLPKSDIETFGLQPGRGYSVNEPKDWKPGEKRKRAIQQLIPTQDKKDHIRSRLGKHVKPSHLPEQGVSEGLGKDIKRLATGRDVKSRAGQEIAKSQDASMKGDTKTSKKHFDRYDKLDKLVNKEQGVAEGSESKDTLISTLNSFGYYTDDSRVYVNDDGDKIVRVGSEWKHQSGKRGRGAEELGDFLSSNQGVAEGSENQLDVNQLAAISDATLDAAYGYGRSSPSNTFGWQANLKSAAYAKQMIDAGVTDIEKISDAIHKGWNVTARAFVQDPDQFDDTEKLRAAGKLDAKLAQRSKLMNINYAQLPDEEQEKDRVVARALLKAIRGEQAVSEDLDTNQQRVGQLGPKAKHAKPGDLVGVDESTDQLAAMRRLSGLIK